VLRAKDELARLLRSAAKHAADDRIVRTWLKELADGDSAASAMPPTGKARVGKEASAA
jgi:hypothetical protein